MPHTWSSRLAKLLHLTPGRGHPTCILDFCCFVCFCWCMIGCCGQSSWSDLLLGWPGAASMARSQTLQCAGQCELQASSGPVCQAGNASCMPLARLCLSLAPRLASMELRARNGCSAGAAARCMNRRCCTCHQAALVEWLAKRRPHTLVRMLAMACRILIEGVTVCREWQ
jgi:hypothetical protein